MVGNTALPATAGDHTVHLAVALLAVVTWAIVSIVRHRGKQRRGAVESDSAERLIRDFVRDFQQREQAEERSPRDEPPTNADDPRNVGTSSYVLRVSGDGLGVTWGASERWEP